MSFRCSPYFWVRSAGFPCAWLDALAVRESALELARRIEAEAGAGADFERAFAADAAAARRMLLELMGEPRVREALYLSNRDALERVDALRAKGAGGPLNARTRQHLRLAWSYLQRLCSKNDTASFFGPIAWGRFASSGERPPPPAELAAVTRAPGSWLRARRVFFEHWALQLVADAISGDPEVAPFLPLHVNPGCHIEGDRLRIPIDRSVPLPRPAAEALRALSVGAPGWPRAAGELAARLAEEAGSGLGAAEDLLASLLAKGVLSRRLMIPTAMPRPEAVLTEALDALPDACAGRDRWRAFVGELLALRDAFERADLEERRRIDAALSRALLERCGASLTREAGKMYIGRYVLYEDCARDLDLVLSGELRGELEAALGPVLEAFRGMMAAVAAAITARWMEAYAALDGGDDGVDFLRFHRQVRERVDVGEIVARVRERLRDAWSSVLPPPGEAPEELALSPADLRRFGEQVGAWTAELAAPLPLECEVHSPDLMIAARSLEDLCAGRYRVIVGEIHPGVHTVSQAVAQPFCPFVAELLEETRALLSPESVVLVDPPESYQRSNINWLDCDVLHELVPPGCASRLPPERRIPAGRARVVVEGGRLRCRDPESGRSGDLLTVMPGAFHRAAFQLSREVLGGDYPARLLSGRLVLKRRTWQLDPGSLPEVERPGEEAESFAALSRWARARGLPRWVFLSSDREPKPIFVDFQSPMAVDLFYKVARQASAARVSEMRPSPEELWLRDERGAYTCELRTSFTRAR
jgi:Lantibiotic dehydratase, N terminus